MPFSPVIPATPATPATPLTPLPSRARAARRRRGLLGALLGLALATAACTSPAVQRSVTLPLAKMQQQLDGHFPRRFALGGLADLELLTPRLALRPERNRLHAVLPLQASGSALRTAYHGSLEVEFALRYEAGDHTVRAHALQVQALRLDGLAGPAAQWLERLGPQLAQQALREVVLYTLQPSELALADGLGLQPGAMTVTPRGLVIALEPKARAASLQ